MTSPHCRSTSSSRHTAHLIREKSSTRHEEVQYLHTKYHHKTDSFPINHTRCVVSTQKYATQQCT